MAHACRPSHLEPSRLGTQEYWDELYTTELANHAADPSDIGTVWFDDADAESKILAFLADLAADRGDEDEAPTPAPTSASSPSLDRHTTSFLDLGCGNGSLLFALRDDGWTGRALGVDYSPQSVALARQVAASRDAQATASPPVLPPPEFRRWDVVSGPLDAVLDGAQRSGWHLVLDKGTFDAVSLSGGDDDARGLRRRPCEGYRERVLRLLRPGGLFLVTSCNWTEDELADWFERRSSASGSAGLQQERDERSGDGDGNGDEEGRLVIVGRVAYRTWSFGGVKGQPISTLCFRKEP